MLYVGIKSLQIDTLRRKFMIREEYEKHNNMTIQEKVEKQS